MYTSISNCKEIQFITGNAAGDHEMSSAAWSVTMDEGGVWYHIAVVSDGHEISTYVNGCEAFRDYASDAMVGMYADPDDGRFRIGSSWWEEGSQTLDKFLQGSLQEVRISNAPLGQEDWLIPDPTEYAGEFGSNKDYELKHEDNYNIVLLPDTQNCVEFCGEEGGVMDTAIKELIDTADDLNVIGVVGLGDIVDDNNATQYATAKRIFYQLPKSGIKTLLQPGNHDGWNWSDSYSQTFGAGSEWAERLTNGYLTTYDWSGCMFVQGGDRVYMIMSIANEGGKTSWNGNNRELNWFKSMLEKYKNIPTIVTTHDVQNCSDTEPSAIKLSKQGQKLWNLVRGYDQVFMMVGGHSHGSGVEILKNDNSKDVISILTDFQFGYNGGNGWFRYLEFDETDNKIYYSVYSPYAASLDEENKSFFDVNFLTGKGNEGVIDWNFEDRFDGLDKAPQAEKATEGKWMSGEYHTHTGQSKDATESFMSLENVLGTAFRNQDVLNANSATKTGNITVGDGFDYLMLADHLRKSYNGVNENGSRQYNVPFYVAAQTQLRELEKLQLQGLYTDKILYSGFEWDMPGLDHAAVGLIDSDSDTVPVQGIHQFEWIYGSQKDGDDTSLYDGDKVNGRTYAFVALERIGGIMVYDITDPANAKFVNYINSREFDAAIQGDVSPEGLCFVSASDSKTGNALLLAACEVSGTLAVYELTVPSKGGSGGSSGGSSSTGTYSVTVDKIANGTVIAAPKTASKGDTVTLTVTPDKGYALEILTVTDSSGKDVAVAEKNGKYTFTMPASKVTVKAAFMEDNSMLNFFVDVPASAYYYDAVLWAAEKGITGGTDATHFSPNATCTRAQAVTFLWRAAGSPVVNYAMNFTDVSADAYYAEAVRWAVSQGITRGTTDTAFSPNATCSRAQIVTFLWRSQKSPAAGTVNPFTDVAADAYYEAAVLWAAENNITGGTSATTFSPASNCTRAQIVTFLWRAFAE